MCQTLDKLFLQRRIRHHSRLKLKLARDRYMNKYYNLNLINTAELFQVL